MDTVSFVLLTLALLLLSNIGTVLLALRYRRMALKAQQEVVLLAYFQRVASYDTGLVEPSIVQVPKSA